MLMNIALLTLLILGTLAHGAQLDFPKDFVFGVANAPAQVEDGLDDPWLEWGKKGLIRTWKVELRPSERIGFWTQPEKEFELAEKLGIQSFRMGIDWGRVMPDAERFDQNAIARYKEILTLAKKKNLRVMLTLMHHSVPGWFMKEGGWHEEKAKKHFIKFSLRMMREFYGDVEQWVTFNEANVFVVNSYTTGIWPPGEKRSPFSLFALGPIRGSTVKALDLMAEAHNELYDLAHNEFPGIKIGLAHNMANYTSRSLTDRVSVYFADQVMNWRFPEKIRGRMDFFGFNYYGAEWLKGAGLELNPEEEYSEAGRAIDVNGLYYLLKEIHQRFPGLPVLITENGIADSGDSLRGSYLIEHLLAVQKAISEAVPVKAYYVWTLTDNLEWSDGYCPKFGLVAVDRSTMKRIPRDSFFLFQSIIRERKISSQIREDAWKKVLAVKKSLRPFCRDEDGITSYDEARPRSFSVKDWRFNLR